MAKRVNPELAVLRSLAIRKTRNASDKIRRIRQAENGPIVAGTSHDPRREFSKINKYNSRQLHAYIKQLNTFNARTTQFVADSKKRPMPIKLWQKYKSQEDAMNERKAKEFNRVKDMRLPNGMTIGEYDAMTTPAVPQMANPAINSPYAKTNRKSRAVVSEKALKKLTKDSSGKWTKTDLRKRTQEGRRIANDMLSLINDNELMGRLDSLSDSQFNVLWNYSKAFAHNLTLLYALVQKRMREGDNLEDGYISAVEYSAYDEVRELVDWAEELPRK